MPIRNQVEKIIYADHYNPFEVLGVHGTTIKIYEPHAIEVSVFDPANPDVQYKLHEARDQHFFENTFDWGLPFSIYKVKAVYQNGDVNVFYDPYCFNQPLLTDLDLHLFNEGNYHFSYQKLGAHIRNINGIMGVNFAVWAPNARRVSVIGNFNNWDGRKHQMRTLGSSGIWELFIPGLQEGETYKYEIKTQIGHLYQKIDPYSFFTELRPKSGCIVADINKYHWQDQDWINRRQHTNPIDRPISIYEVHLGSWIRSQNNDFINYRDIAPKLAEHIKKTGFTHIELLPIAEHPFDDSWGYQVINYYAPTSRFGTPEDFMYFVDYMHQHNIGVIMDWVPAHFPRDGHGLSYFDGSHLYEHQDPRKGEHKDWGTLIFNYGRNEVRNFLASNALFWIDKYHLDGLRVDAVASMLYLDYSRKEGEWMPNIYGGRENLEAISFIQRTNEMLFKYFPNIIMAAEESTAYTGVSKPTYAGGLGFNFKWNMGWMNDFLTYISKDPIHRKYHQNLITFSLLYAFHENFILSLSHDEVVHGKKALLDKMPGDVWQKFANMRSLIAYMYGHPGKKLLFMGMELGQWNEWWCQKQLDWNLLEFESHHKLIKCLFTLNEIYKNESALYEDDYSWNGFEWINFSDEDNSIISFIRWNKNRSQSLVFVCNFTPTVRKKYRVGVPFNCYYKEIFNSDNEIFWGKNVGNVDGFQAEQKGCDNKPCSISLTLPPLATLILKPV